MDKHPDTSRTASSVVWRVALAIGGAVIVGGMVQWVWGAPETTQLSLTPQECVTACQTDQTDCILGCEGRKPCQKRCRELAKTCVQPCLPKKVLPSKREPLPGRKSRATDAGVDAGDRKTGNRVGDPAETAPGAAPP